MATTKTKKQIAIDLKNAIQTATFLDAKGKKEWLDLVVEATLKELLEIRAFFNKAKKAQDIYKLKIIHEANMDGEYINKIKKISDNYVKKAIKYNENNQKESAENPEDILKKLDKT